MSLAYISKGNRICLSYFILTKNGIKKNDGWKKIEKVNTNICKIYYKIVQTYVLFDIYI